MALIKFVIPTVPVAQPRQRHATRGGMVVSYLPQDHPVWAFKSTARYSASQVYQGAPLEGPLFVHAVFVMPRPKALCWKRKPMPRQWHTAKPDSDNLQKALYDALSGMLWRDDRQICQSRTDKVIASGDEAPRVEVTVNVLED